MLALTPSSAVSALRDEKQSLQAENAELREQLAGACSDEARLADSAAAIAKAALAPLGDDCGVKLSSGKTARAALQRLRESRLAAAATA